MTRGHADEFAGVGSGAAAFAVYVWTLAPGLIDIRDTPAFQYMGRVLGIPHQPGYPFYLLISWAFSYLPVGSLAYRMNLLSAVFGAGTVTVAYFVLRRAGCRIAVAAGTATAAGLGPVVWSQCLIAEVYSLESFLIMSTVLALLRWRDGRREAVFYGAALLFGLAVAHHPNDVLLAPGVLAFVWITDRRWLLDLRRTAVAIILAAAAFLPYVYLIVRTSQHAPYVLEPARSLSDVVRIMTGAGYRENVFPFSLDAVLGSRLPMAVSLIAGELTWLGCAALIAGLGSLTRARHPLGALLVLGLTGLLAFALNYDVPDIAVFFIPVFWLAWIAAGHGAERVVRAVARRAPPWERAAGTACALLPLWFVASHGHEVSLRGRVATMRWADALVSGIRTPAVILEEDWVIDQVVRYKLLGEGLPPGRVVLGPSAFDPSKVDGWTASNTAVYAFPRKAGLLRLMGWPIDRQLVRVSFESFADSQRPDSIVAIAAPAEQSAAMVGEARGALGRLGLGSGVEAGLYTAYAALGVRGAPSNGAQAMQRHRASVQVARGERIGLTARVAPSGIAVTADGTEARISVDGREIVRTTRGIAVAVWGPGGDLREVRVVSGRSALTVPLELRPLFAVRGPRTCTGLHQGVPADVTQLAGSGTVSLQFPAAGQLTLAGRDGALAGLRIVDSAAGSPVSVSVRRAAGGSEAVFSSGGAPGTASVMIALGRVPAHITARWEGRAAAGGPASVCAVETGGLLDPVDDRTFVLRMANDDQAILVGAGWSKPDPAPGGPVRTTVGGESAVLVPLPAGAGWNVRIAAAPAPDSAAPQPTVTLAVNGQALGVRTMAPGWQTVEWSIPASVTRPVNELALVTSSRVVVGSFSFSRQ